MQNYICVSEWEITSGILGSDFHGNRKSGAHDLDQNTSQYHQRDHETIRNCNQMQKTKKVTN